MSKVVCLQRRPPPPATGQLGQLSHRCEEAEPPPPRGPSPRWGWGSSPAVLGRRGGRGRKGLVTRPSDKRCRVTWTRPCPGRAPDLGWHTGRSTQWPRGVERAETGWGRAAGRGACLHSEGPTAVSPTWGGAAWSEPLTRSAARVSGHKVPADPGCGSARRAWEGRGQRSAEGVLVTAPWGKPQGGAVGAKGLRAQGQRLVGDLCVAGPGYDRRTGDWPEPP